MRRRSAKAVAKVTVRRQAHGVRPMVYGESAAKVCPGVFRAGEPQCVLRQEMGFCVRDDHRNLGAVTIKRVPAPSVQSGHGAHVSDSAGALLRIGLHFPARELKGHIPIQVIASKRRPGKPVKRENLYTTLVENRISDRDAFPLTEYH